MKKKSLRIGMAILGGLALVAFSSCGINSVTVIDESSANNSSSNNIESSTISSSSSTVSSSSEQISSEASSSIESSNVASSQAASSCVAQSSNVVSSQATSSSIAQSSNVASSSVASSSRATASVSEITDIEDSAFQIVTLDGAYEELNGVYTITKAGTYTVKGELEEGYILVNIPDTETSRDVIIELSGTSIKSTVNSPICILSADSVDISAKKDTTNIITDNRTSIDETDESQGTAAIYSACDLKIKGKGYLYVYGNINNGIHSKDDLDLKNCTLYVKAKNNALKGNDSVTIDTLTATIISEAGDGIKTTASDISTKGNQRGIIKITGSSLLDIYACCDGIDAAYDFISEEDLNGNSPTINIYTNTYSGYTLDDASSLESTMYFSISSSYYSSSRYYYAYLFNAADTENGEWVQLNLTTTQSQGFGGVTYYLSCEIDKSYDEIQFYIFNSNTPSLTSYYALSTAQTFNETKDMFQVRKVSSSKISGDWSNYSSSSQQQGPGGMGMMDQGNTDKTSYSTKGIKADNEITISSGVFVIESYDDALHASSDVTLENGNTSTGNVTITGGDLTITSKDDGIHSDSALTISGGTVNILTAYEGIEGNSISISGGNVYVYATDDGLNGSGNNAKIEISGGLLNVRVASGDTDAIDCNGTYKQTGGIVLTSNMSTTGTATALDTDSTATITGGTFIAFGKLETTPSVSNIKNTTISATFSSGNYTLNDSSNVLLEFELFTSYTSMYIASTSGSYTLYKNGTSFKTISL